MILFFSRMRLSDTFQKTNSNEKDGRKTYETSLEGRERSKKLQKRKINIVHVTALSTFKSSNSLCWSLILV